MKRIELTQGYWAIIDDEDFEMLMRFHWQANRLIYAKMDSEFVAVRTCYCPFDNKHKHTIFMYRQILSCPRGMVVDHINHNQLDNRKENLRICTTMQNKQNGSSHKGSSSQYKGLCWFPPTKRWQAYIRVNTKKVHLGYFLDEQAAASAYDKAAVKHFKQFANTNF